MSSELATEISGRVRKLLDGLLATRGWGQLSSVPLLGQSLYTRYSDWVDGLLSGLHLPLASAPLLGPSSSLWFLPLSYAWFDKRWIDSRKRSRSFRKQSGSKKDEDIQGLSVPEYFFEEDAEESLINQFQSAQSEPANDIILSVPALLTLSPGNTEFMRAEHLAKKIPLRLELLTNKGSPAPWHTPFDANDVPYYPGLVTNNNLLAKGKEIMASQHLSHLEESFYPSSSMDLSPPNLNPVSGQYIGTVLMPVAGKLLQAERTPTQSVSRFVPPSEGMNSNFELSGSLPAAPGGQPAGEPRLTSLLHLSGLPSITSNSILASKVFPSLELSGALPIALNGPPASEARIASLSHLSETPSMTSNNIPARKVFSRFELSGALPAALSGQSVSKARIGSLSHLSETPFVTSNNIPARKVFSGFQSIFGTPLLASSTALMGKALTASPSYLFEPPQVASYAVPAEKADTIPVYLPEEPPPFHRDEITDMTSVAYRYLEMLAPQPSLDKTWGSHHRSQLHWSAGHIPPSLTEEAISEETGEPVKAAASTIRNNSSGGYNKSAEPPLFRRDETPDMASAAYQYLEMLAPQPSLDKTWGSRQTSPLHWSAGHIPPSLTEEAISQEMGEPVKAVASTIKNSSSGVYNRGMEVGLALAPVGRQRENISSATSNTASGGQEGASEAVGETMPALDSEALASEVYSILKRRLIVEMERTTSVV